MAVNALLVRAYAINIYRYGNRTFDSIPVDYHVPVKQYAGENFALWEIDRALEKKYITEQEYNETLAYVPKESTE